MFRMTPHLSVPTKYYDMVSSGRDRLFSDTEYIDSLHIYLLKSLLTRHGTAVCLECKQLLLIQMLYILHILLFLHCNGKYVCNKNIPLPDT